MLKITVNTITVLITMLAIPQIVNAAQLDEWREAESLQPSAILVYEVPRNDIDLPLVKEKIVYSRKELLTFNKTNYSESEVKEFLKSVITSFSKQNLAEEGCADLGLETYLKVLNAELHDQFLALIKSK